MAGLPGVPRELTSRNVDAKKRQEGKRTERAEFEMYRTLWIFYRLWYALMQFTPLFFQSPKPFLAVEKVSQYSKIRSSKPLPCSGGQVMRYSWSFRCYIESKMH